MHPEGFHRTVQVLLAARLLLWGALLYNLAHLAPDRSLPRDGVARHLRAALLLCSAMTLLWCVGAVSRGALLGMLAVVIWASRLRRREPSLRDVSARAGRASRADRLVSSMRADWRARVRETLDAAARADDGRHSLQARVAWAGRAALLAACVASAAFIGRAPDGSTDMLSVWAGALVGLPPRACGPALGAAIAWLCASLAGALLVRLAPGVGRWPAAVVGAAPLAAVVLGQRPTLAWAAPLVAAWGCASPLGATGHAGRLPRVVLLSSLTHPAGGVLAWVASAVASVGARRRLPRARWFPALLPLALGETLGAFLAIGGRGLVGAGAASGPTSPALVAGCASVAVLLMLVRGPRRHHAARRARRALGALILTAATWGALAPRGWATVLPALALPVWSLLGVAALTLMGLFPLRRAPGAGLGGRASRRSLRPPAG